MFTRIIDFLDKFLVCFPYILIIASTIVFIYSFFSGLLNRYFTEVVIILGSAFIASIFLIYTRKNQGDDNILCSHLFSFQQKRLTVIFLITASLLLIANLQANGRPFYLLILLGSLYIIIILQIFSNGCKPGIVLLELVAATAFLIVPQFFSPAFYYGCGDVLPHTKWVNLIIETGSISELLGEYSSYFTYHVLSAMLGQTGNIADNTAVYAVSAVAFMTSVLFVFYLFKGMSKNTWISLLGAFLYITANVLLLNFLKPAPRIMASVAFVILLYLIFKRWNTVTIPSILGGIVSVYLVLTHHAQAPVFLFVLGLLCMGNILYQNRLFVGNKIVYILYLVSLIAYFIYTYLAFILSWVEHHVISYIESWSVQEISMVVAQELDVPIIFLQESFQNVFIIVLGLMGLYLLVVATPRTSILKTLLPFSLVGFLFITGMLNLIPGMSGLGIYRWRMVLIIFFALLMALGAAYFITTMANRHPNKKRLGTAVMLVVCICIAVTSPVLLNSWDNDVQYTDAFTPKEYFYVDSDLSLFNYMSENIESGSTIYSDREHTKYSYHDSTSSIYYPYYSFSYQMMPMFEEIGAEINTQYLIFPEAKYQRTGIWILTGPESRALVTESEETTDIFNTNTYRYSTIYNNGDTMNYFSA